MNQFIQDIQEVRTRHGCKDVFKSPEEFEQFMLMYHRGFTNTDELPFNYKKAHVLKELISDIQDQLHIEDHELHEMLSYIVGSAV